MHPIAPLPCSCPSPAPPPCPARRHSFIAHVWHALRNHKASAKQAILVSSRPRPSGGKLRLAAMEPGSTAEMNERHEQDMKRANFQGERARSAFYELVTDIEVQKASRHGHGGAHLSMHGQVPQAQGGA